MEPCGCPFERQGGSKYYGSVGKTHRAVGQRHPGAPTAHQVEALREAGQGKPGQLGGGGVDDLLHLVAHQGKLPTTLRHQLHPAAAQEGRSYRELGHQEVHGGGEEERATAKPTDNNTGGKTFPKTRR